MPEAGAGELRIRVSASGINRPDVLQRTGNYPVPPGASDIPGLEVAGVIDQGDAGELALHAGFKLGDRVCALVAGGGYAEYCVAPIGAMPAGAQGTERCAGCESAGNLLHGVEQCVRPRAPAKRRNLAGAGWLQRHRRHGDSNGHAMGCRVIVTVGSDEKAAACAALGADHAINYRTQDFVQEVKRLTDGRGVDVVLDMVAGDYVAREIECLAEDGRLVIIAVQGGIKSGFNAGMVLRRRLTITGSTLRPRPIAFKQAIAQSCLKNVWPLIESGLVKPVIHSSFEALQAEGDLPSGAARAHALMESNQHIGKLVITWRKGEAP